jgi:nitrogen fixation-related uncharacterized protein
VTTRILIPLALSLVQLALMIAAPFHVDLGGALVIEFLLTVGLAMYAIAVQAALWLRDSAERNGLDRPLDRRWFK